MPERRVNLGSKGPQLLTYLADQSQALLTNLAGLDTDIAREISQALSGRLALDWGGQQIWIPRDCYNRSSLVWFERNKRDIQLYLDFDGTNRVELCQKYNISIARLYQIVNSVRDHLRKSGPA